MLYLLRMYCLRCTCTYCQTASSLPCSRTRRSLKASDHLIRNACQLPYICLSESVAKSKCVWTMGISDFLLLHSLHISRQPAPLSCCRVPQRKKRCHSAAIPCVIAGLERFFTARLTCRRRKCTRSDRQKEEKLFRDTGSYSRRFKQTHLTLCTAFGLKYPPGSYVLISRPVLHVAFCIICPKTVKSANVGLLHVLVIQL